METDEVATPEKETQPLPGKNTSPPPASSTTTTSSTAPSSTSTSIVSEEEDARQTIEALRGEDVMARVAAANRLEMVAATLGHQRTRDELVPFLSDGVDDEDEVLAAIATSIGKLVPHVGGPEHAHTLLPTLEILLSVEESTVRENASKSAQQISSILPTTSFHNQYASMISRLAQEEWFTARISACTLIASSFTRLTSQHQESHVQHFASLCRDEVPMVRRVAAQHLGPLLISVVELNGVTSSHLVVGQDGMLSTTFIPLYEELASSDQPDSVKLQTTENCIAFGHAMTLFYNQQEEKGMQTDEMDDDAAQLLVKKILPLIVNTIEDRSWRVRWTAASKFAQVVKSFERVDEQGDGVFYAMDELIPAYEKLLQDPEAEVRTAATMNLATVAKCKATVIAPQPSSSLPSSSGGEEEENNTTSATTSSTSDTTKPTTRLSVAKRLVKQITSLTEDDNENVRAGLAMVATGLAPILGKDATISDLVPPVLLLLRDSVSEVRLNVISSLGALNEVIGVDLLSQSLLPAILDLADDGKWRIRLAIMQHIPHLARQLGKEFFTEKLTSLCVGWLEDDISTIRQAATINLKELTEIFGAEWAASYLIPSLNDVCQHKSYLRRLTAVQAFSLMATAMKPELTRTEILPLVLEMATDNVANIRFNVAKGLEIIAPMCGHSICDSQIRPVLSLLSEDPDRDVRFFANKSLKLLDAQTS